MYQVNRHAIAMVFAAGLVAACGWTQPAGAAPAADQQEDAGKSAETVRPAKHRRHVTRHRISKSVRRSTDDKPAKVAKAEDKTEVVAPRAESVPASSAMPPWVANANAQLASADTPLAAAATAMTAQANDNLQQAAADKAAAPPAASDQLSEADRALLQDTPAPQKTVIAAVDAQPRPAPVMATATSDSTTWDQTSLIGKIFIGFGALLTLASAARMFMA